MSASYSANYRDEFGVETATIFNDGKMLSLVLRGTEFKGKNFHSFTISNDAEISSHRLFNLFSDELQGYSIDCDIPVWFGYDNEILKIPLHIHVEYGKPDAENKIVEEVLLIKIKYQGKTYSSSGKNFYDTFDEQLGELGNSLPSGTYLKTCWNCVFSDYLPSGSGMFGELGCFRNIKDEYRKIKDKETLMLLWSSRTEDVQEIHVCSEFEKRQVNIGGL